MKTTTPTHAPSRMATAIGWQNPPPSSDRTQSPLRVAHILRKYDPLEWGGTETAVLRLLEGLAAHGVQSSVHCPALAARTGRDPLAEAGAQVRRYHAFLPVAGISGQRRRQLVRWGGNLMSFDLFTRLLREPLDVIHTHALNRLGGIGLAAARWRNLPLVVTIHGGWFDLPAEAMAALTAPLLGGFEWGRVLGLLLQSRRLLEKADAVLTCNPREADLIRQRHPHQRVLVQPHSVPAARYAVDHRAEARQAFPQIAGRDVVLCVARLDPVKNQRWLVDQLPVVVKRHPRALLVFAGPETFPGYEATLRHALGRLGLEDRVLFTGSLEPGGGPLIGLLQHARATVLSSTAETFGLAIIEAWAAGSPVICSRTSGAESLIRHGETGWLFPLDNPAEFHAALDRALQPGPARERMIDAASTLVRTTYDTVAAARRVGDLYAELHQQKPGRNQP